MQKKKKAHQPKNFLDPGKIYTPKKIKSGKEIDEAISSKDKKCFKHEPEKGENPPNPTNKDIPKEESPDKTNEKIHIKKEQKKIQ